jgi:hypothetical protein
VPSPPGTTAQPPAEAVRTAAAKTGNQRIMARSVPA